MTPAALKAAFADFIAAPGEPTPAELDAIGAKVDRFIDAELDRLRRARHRARVAAQAQPFGGASARPVAAE